jgi:triosephosphate isomerase
MGEEAANKVRILYGGSMKPENAAELLAQKNIDGGLIGGASLKANSFAAIVESALELSK